MGTQSTWGSTPASTLTTTTARPSTQFKPLLSLPNTSLHISQNATKGRRQEARHQGTSCKGTSQTRSWKEDQCDRKEEENKDAQGDLLFIHLQSPQASPPRRWYLQPRHVNFELLRQWHLRACCHRGLQACRLQQEVHHFIPRDPNICPPHPPWRTRQARRFRRYQGRHKVLLINEIGCFSVWVFIGCRICFGFGSSGLVMKSDLFRDPRVSFNALWMVCFLWGHMSSTVCFSGYVAVQ